MYFIIAGWGHEDRRRAALMLFIYTLSTYWFGGTGSTLLSELSLLEKSPVLADVGFVAIVIGLGYKAALVPFHFWAPDAYQGAPISVAAHLSVVPKIGAIFALAQVVIHLPVNSAWQWIIAAVAALTMTLGYLAALVQRHVVRLTGLLDHRTSGVFPAWNNGITPLFLWYALHTKGVAGFKEIVNRCIENAKYAVCQLQQAGINAWRNSNSITVIFPRPNPDIASKWQLAVEGNIAHLITMPHVTRDKIDQFVTSILAPTTQVKEHGQ